MAHHPFPRRTLRRAVALVPLLVLLVLPLPAAAAGPLVQTARLTSSGAQVCGGYPDCFGVTAALSADGNTALVSVANDHRAAGADYADGAAFFFVRNGTAWTQQGGKFINPNVDTEGAFGGTVALSGDGNTALIGATNRTYGYSGSVHVFTRTGTAWNQQQVLEGGSLVSAVAVSRDGNTALLGSAYGSVIVYVRTGTTWSQQQVLGASTYGYFGASVALSGDGNTALIGAWIDTDVGAAYVFTRTGSTWTQQQKLTGTEQRADCYSSYCAFGWSVALSDDGNTALIGELNSSVTGIGAAFVFTRSGTTWSAPQKLTGSDSVPILQFGIAAALSGDGKTALIGGNYSGPSTGRAYVFTRSSITWSQQQTLIGGNAPGCYFSNACLFGSAVALNGDASTALIGSPGDDDGTGAAYVFTNSRTLASIALSGTTPLEVGQVAQWHATGTFSDMTTAPLQYGTWQSSTPTVATVDASGNVTGQTAGTVTITYTLDGVVGQSTVTITAPTPIGITIPSGRASGATSGSGAPSPAPAPRSIPVGPAASGGTTTPPASVQPIPTGR